MVDRVHHHAAVVRLLAHPALAPGLAELLVGVVGVRDRADAGHAIAAHQAQLAGHQLDLRIAGILADQLRILPGSPRDLATRAREGKLKPDDIEGGTYTVSNVGTFGNVMGTPVILQPQVAILATGAIKKKPVVIETEQGDTIGIRHMMFLSHSYDHRIVDGALGGSFVRRVADYLEQFDVNRDI